MGDKTNPERLVWFSTDVCNAIGISRKTLERLRADGLFAPPDLMVGPRRPAWRPSTVEAWIERGGSR